MEPFFATRKRDHLIEACLHHPGLNIRFYPDSDVIYAENASGDEVVEGVADHSEADDNDEYPALRRAVARAAARLAVRSSLRQGIQKGSPNATH